MTRLFTRTALLSVTIATFAFAQMGSGMGSNSGSGMMGPGNSGTPSGSGMTSVQGMGSGMGMIGAMGSREMMDGPTVGPDGTVYVVRLASTSTTNQGMMNPGTGTSQYELVALSPVNGSAKWKLAITGTMVSEPVLGKDGKIFMTASDYVMNGQSQSGGGVMNPGTSTTSSGKSRLIIVTAYPTTASISATITVDSDVLSAPRTADDVSSYVIYVTGFEMGVDDKDSVASGQKTLYAFTPAGATKFSVKLN